MKIDRMFTLSVILVLILILTSINASVIPVGSGYVITNSRIPDNFALAGINDGIGSNGIIAIIGTLVKNEAPLMASTSSSNSHENRMSFRASSAHHLDNSNTNPFAKIQLEKSFHTTATAERKYDHHFVEDSYCLEQEDQGRF